jgi:hypothetical protein|tara:strand:+ start:2300 stop:2551 length:252 start_codon:yes stop_codon:yes gene_type:complete
MNSPVKIDFEMSSNNGEDYGEYFEDTNRIAIYLKPHSECIPNLLATISHELFHKIITDTEETLDIEQEHKLIKRLMWFEQDIV